MLKIYFKNEKRAEEILGELLSGKFNVVFEKGIAGEISSTIDKINYYQDRGMSPVRAYLEVQEDLIKEIKTKFGYCDKEIYYNIKCNQRRVSSQTFVYVGIANLRRSIYGPDDVSVDDVVNLMSELMTDVEIKYISTWQDKKDVFRRMKEAMSSKFKKKKELGVE